MNISNPMNGQFLEQIVDTESLKARFVAPHDWDKIAVQFRDVLHEQTQCFNALRWSENSLERVAFYKEGELVSGAVVLMLKIPLLKSGVAVVKWGPLWRKNGNVDDTMVLVQTITALRRIYADERGLFLSFFPRADAEVSSIEEHAFKSCGFYKGEQITSPERYFVNTDLPLDEIRASLGQKWRYNLKKAEKNGLTTRRVEGPGGVSIFMELYDRMLERKTFHDTSAIGTLCDLMAAEEEALRPLILLVEKDREAIAGAVVDVSGERAVYLYGATNDKALPLNAGYLMHWEIVKLLAADPLNKWYDLGGGDAANHLHQFKRGFIGKKGVIAITPQYYHFAGTARARLFGELLYFARRTKGRLARKIHDFRFGRKA